MPKLCVPLLLGLPFLSVNHIIANLKLCSAIDKTSNYDLLKALVTKTSNKIEKSKFMVAGIKKTKKQVLLEFVKVCKQCLTDRKMVPEVIKLLNVVGMIKNQIEMLSSQQKVEGLEKERLTEFNNVF